jgi:hypothetical protein
MPQMPDFAGKPLNQWSLVQLEAFVAGQRGDPPKFRALIDWMRANNVQSMVDLDDDVIEVCRKLNLGTVFATPADVLLKRNSKIVEGQADEAAKGVEEAEAQGP